MWQYIYNVTIEKITFGKSNEISLILREGAVIFINKAVNKNWRLLSNWFIVHFASQMLKIAGLPAGISNWFVDQNYFMSEPEYWT